MYHFLRMANSKSDNTSSVSSAQSSMKSVKILKPYICDICGGGLTRLSNFKVHMKQFHDVTYKVSKTVIDSPKKHACTICDYNSDRVDNFKRHMLKAHDTIYESKNTLHARTPCGYEGCDEKFYKKLDLIHHWEVIHSVNIEKSEHTFDTMDDFLQWKDKEELINFVHFSKQSSTHITGKGSLSYYICQHDGSDRAHRKKGEPDRKTSKRYKNGRVKTGKFCPARMCVSETDGGQVNVKYIRSHSHEVSIQNTVHPPLPKSVAPEIHKNPSPDFTVGNSKFQSKAKKFTDMEVFQSKLQTLSELLENDAVRQHCLPKFNTNLSDMIRDAEAVLSCQ